jgi:hypothetical protein
MCQARRKLATAKMPTKGLDRASPALAVVVSEAHERKIATDLEVAPFDLANRARQRAYGARRLVLALRPRGHDRLEFGDRRPDRV